MAQYKFKINGKEYNVSIGAAEGKNLTVKRRRLPGGA